MKTRFLIFCLLAFIIVSSLACPGTSPDNLEYKESDSGKTVTTHVNDSFKLTLGATGSSSWDENCTIDDESVIKQIGHEDKSGGTALLPMITQIWTFKAVGTGEATITNEYGSYYAGSQNLDSFTLHIVVE